MGLIFTLLAVSLFGDRPQPADGPEGSDVGQDPPEGS